MLYIQEFYRVELSWPAAEAALDRRGGAERVRDGLERRKRPQVARLEVERVAKVDLAGHTVR